MKIKKILKKLKNIKEKIDSKMLIGGYKIKLKYILNQKDPELQDGRRFLSVKKKEIPTQRD